MVYKLVVFSCQVVLFQRITRLKHHPGLSSARFSQNKWFFLGRKNKHSSSKFVSFSIEWNEMNDSSSLVTKLLIQLENRTLSSKKIPRWGKIIFHFQVAEAVVAQRSSKRLGSKTLQGCGFYSSKMLGFYANSLYLLIVRSKWDPSRRCNIADLS